MFQAVKSTSCISSFKPYNNLANTVSIAILQMRKQDGRDLPRVLELVGSLVRVEILVVLTHKPISFSLSFVVITRIKGRENNKLVELFRHPGGNVGQRYKWEKESAWSGKLELWENKTPGDSENKEKIEKEREGEEKGEYKTGGYLWPEGEMQRAKEGVREIIVRKTRIGQRGEGWVLKAPASSWYQSGMEREVGKGWEELRRRKDIAVLGRESLQWCKDRQANRRDKRSDKGKENDEIWRRKQGWRKFFVCFALLLG